MTANGEPSTDDVSFRPRSRGGVCVRADALTWHHSLFAVEDPERVVYVLRARRDTAAFLSDVDSGLLDAELREMLDRAPRTRLTRRRARKRLASIPTGVLAGLENEYSLFAGDTQLDFREMIHTLAIDGVRADPSDPNAYRCSWGGAITCDGNEAEIAIPPVEIEAGFTSRIASLTERGEDALRILLPGVRLEGYSTHVSVSLEARADRRLARLYAQTFAPALMLLMDRTSSPGLLVRPRPGRLELCGEYVNGEPARAVAAFAVGSVRALVRADRRAIAALRVRARVEPAYERYGYYVDRRAFDSDLYADGRKAVLRPACDSSPRTAQAQLTAAWTLARTTLLDDALDTDLSIVDRMVRGAAPLPCESGP